MEHPITPPAEHPSVAWWAACPWITDRPPTAADGDALGRVLEYTRFRVELWEDVAHFYWKGWIHSSSWRPPAPKPLTLGERIDAELANKIGLAPELRALLIEAKAVVGEVMK
jgi:hypothetical protein